MRTRRSQSSSDPVPEAHRPVLLHETLEWLAIEPFHTVVDATLGSSGHATAIAEKLDARGVFLGIDADAEAVERARARLAGARPTVHTVEADFRTISTVLESYGIEHIDRALFDLGWSSEQLTAGRGFSFTHDEPLLMTYAADPDAETVTARDIVNTWDTKHLADVIYGWGEERSARRIAHAIVARRAEKTIETSGELAEIVASAVPAARRAGRRHPATKTFQALRIAVNDEIGAIREGLSDARDALTAGGRIAVITFHSIEDRTVKQLFRDWEEGRLGTAFGPVRPTREAIRENPRARSALLRIFECSFTST